MFNPDAAFTDVDTSLWTDEDFALHAEPTTGIDPIDPFGESIFAGEGRKLVIDQPTLTPTQAMVLTDHGSRVRMYVGGIGAGKTFVSCLDLACTPPNSTSLVLSPTFPMIKDSYLPTFMGLYENKGIIQSFNRSELTMLMSGNRRVLFRSAEAPERLRGITAGNLYIDEAAYVSEDAYLTAIGRIRKQPGRILLTSTPKGKTSWLYRLAMSGNATVYHAPTSSNTFLPAFYLKTLKDNYGGDQALMDQELGGLWVDSEATIFRQEWFTPWEGPLPDRLVMARSWDCAASENKKADWTVGYLVAMMPGSGHLIILDEVRTKLEGDKVDALIRDTAIAARDKYGQVMTLIEQEPGSAGKRIRDLTINALTSIGVKCRWINSGSSKLNRALPLSRWAGQGKVSFIPGPWVQPCMDELCAFTGQRGLSKAEVDDRVDAMSLAYAGLVGSIRKVAAY